MGLPLVFPPEGSLAALSCGGRAQVPSPGAGHCLEEVRSGGLTHRPQPLGGGGPACLLSGEDSQRPAGHSLQAEELPRDHR